MKRLLEAGAAIEKKDKVTFFMLSFLYFCLSCHRVLLYYTHMNRHTPPRPHGVSLTAVCVSAGGHSGPLGLQRRKPAGPAAPSRPGSQAHLQRQGWCTQQSRPVETKVREFLLPHVQRPNYTVQYVQVMIVT